jgi:hypothetical protein
MRRIFLASMILLISGTAHAAGPAPFLPTGQEATRIETDQKTGAIRFIVDGREVARLERDGLHVRGNVEYGGMEKDTGPAGYDKPTPAEPKH